MLDTTPNLLITDDDAALRESLREAFSERGYCTVTAGNGEEALEIIRSSVVHLLLIDMHMPRLTGLETLKAIRDMEAAPPSILISGGLTERLIEEAKSAHAFSVLPKPLRFPEVNATVQEAMWTTYQWSPPAR